MSENNAAAVQPGARPLARPAVGAAVRVLVLLFVLLALNIKRSAVCWGEIFAVVFLFVI